MRIGPWRSFIDDRGGAVLAPFSERAVMGIAVCIQARDGQCCYATNGQGMGLPIHVEREVAGNGTAPENVLRRVLTE